MDNSDLTSGMQEMMAEMAAMRAELNSLKERAQAMATAPIALPQSTLPKPISRRKAFSRIGSSLVAAGLASSLPLLTTSAAPNQQNPPPSNSTSGAGPLVGPSITGVNPNVTPNLVANGFVTQTFIGYDFKPDASNSTYSYGGYGGLFWTGTGDTAFWYRLNLPQGAKVTDVTFYFTDNDATYDLFLGLGINDPLTHGFSYPVSFYTSGASSSARSISATGTAAAPLVTIDNTTYSYELLAEFNSGIGNQILWGARVTYVNILGRFQVQ